MITKAELIARFRNACKSVCDAEAELTDIDAKLFLQVIRDSLQKGLEIQTGA